MEIGDRELRRIGDYVKGNLAAWLGEVAPLTLAVPQLLERSVRIEEELKAQRTLLGERFAAVDRRFEDGNRQIAEHFADANRRFTAMQWLIGGGLLLVTTMMSLYEFIT